MKLKGMMKTKTIHGVKTGNHSNPHVMKRAAGGACAMVDGMGARPRMGAAPRMRANGGSVDADLKRVTADQPKQDMHHFRRGGKVSGSNWKKGDASEDADGDKYANGGWIKGAVGNKKGALHKELGVPMGDKIPAKKLEKAEHSSNPTLKKRAVLARTLKGFSKD